MKVLILAAGYGTRLYPQTKNFPKPLLKIDNKPLITYLVEKTQELKGVSRIIVVCNNHFFWRFQAWKNRLRPKRPIRLLNDLSTSPQDKLGSIGDMYFSFRKENFRGDFLVLGGDNFFSDSLSGFVSFAKARKPAITIGLFDIRDKSKAKRFGVVSINKTARVVKFWEKPQRAATSLVATCLYYLPQEKISLIKKYLSRPGQSRDTAGSYIKWLIHRDKVYGYTFKNLWADIGNKDAYNALTRNR